MLLKLSLIALAAIAASVAPQARAETGAVAGRDTQSRPSDGGWQKINEERNVVVESRPFAGSKFAELRATGHAPYSPEQCFAVIWGIEEYKDFMPHLKTIQILENSQTDQVVYEQVNMPVVTDRDYTSHHMKIADPETHVYQMKFESSQKGPAENEKFVRVKNIIGGWTVEPDEKGGSMISYQLHSEPGGTLPAWIVNTAQKSSIVDPVDAMLKRIAKKYSGK